MGMCIEGGSTMYLVVVLMTLLFQVTCCQQSETCTPSSCGNIRNISYPFRLRGDPPNCGDPDYELVCNNSRTLLYTPYLASKSYHYVEAINYDNYTIRVVDSRLLVPDKHDDRHYCSSRQLSLFSNVLADPSKLDPSISYFSNVPFPSYYSIPVIHIKCRDPMISTRYVDMRCHCEMENTSSATSKYNYSYLVVGESELLIESSCKINKVVSWLSSRSPTTINRNLRTDSSCSEIWNSMLYGIELYWFILCRDCSCRYYPHLTFRCAIRIRNMWKWIKVILTGLLLNPIGEALAARFVLGVIFLSALVINGMIRRRHLSINDNIEEFFQSQHNLMPIRYSYSDIKTMTNGFKQKLGEGGYGSVFKGKLRSGILVAVKIMGKSKATGQEFISEVSIIGRIHHVNVVRLIGFCFEGSKRALIYEFMPNGSLEKFIFPQAEEKENLDKQGAVSLSYETTHGNVVRLFRFCFEGLKRALHPLIYEFMMPNGPNGSLEMYVFPLAEEKERENEEEQGAVSLSYKTMYDISIKVARGIEYLHSGCDMQILHFDIKPHNILLDEVFSPKISDFGLAKLYATDDSIVTMTAARGTMGYMAPELFYKNIGGVSYKADVYSFGMLLMEMAGRRKNLNAFADHLSQIYFPSWVYDQLIEGNDIEEVMEDASDGEKRLVKKMIIVALWCIQMKPCERPSMKKVLEMLEGDVEVLEMPPKPFLCPQDVSGEPEPEPVEPEELAS